MVSMRKTKLFIFQESRDNDNRSWNKITLFGEDGWIPQRIPPAFGIAEQQLTVTRHFKFYYYDLYALVLSALGFVLGFINFKIRPG